MSELFDVANSCELGQNRALTLVTVADAYAGLAMVRIDEEHMRPILTTDELRAAGIAGQMVGYDLDKTYVSGDRMRLITEGYCPAFICSGAHDMNPGVNLYAGDTVSAIDGYLSATKPVEDSLSADPIAILVEPVEAGDSIGIIKLVR